MYQCVKGKGECDGCRECFSFGTYQIDEKEEDLNFILEDDKEE